MLTDALASRFGVQIQVQTDYDLAASLRINSRAVRVARNLVSRQQAGEVGWAPYAESVVMPCRWGQGWSPGEGAWPAST
jgi:nitric oxide reductase NorQ protein